MEREIANMDEPFPVSLLPPTILGDTNHVPQVVSKKLV